MHRGGAAQLVGTRGVASAPDDGMHERVCLWHVLGGRRRGAGRGSRKGAACEAALEERGDVLDAQQQHLLARVLLCKAG